MTKVDLITGILGAGKTTFIKEYAKYFLDKGERIAIIENDFGAVNIDNMLLGELAGDNCELEMVVGGGDKDCHKRRFKTKLINMGMMGFDRVIVEPSGIYDMDEFFDVFYESPVDRWFEIGSVINILDAGLEDNLGEQMEYMLGSQIASAGIVILNKIDGIPENEIASRLDYVLDKVNQALSKISCKRRLDKQEILVKKLSEYQAQDFENIKNAGYKNESFVKLFSMEQISSSVHYLMNVVIDENDAMPLLTTLFEDIECGKIFRIKGYIPAVEGWIKINVTAENMNIENSDKGQAVIIVIGDNLDLARINSYVKTYLVGDVVFISI